MNFVEILVSYRVFVRRDGVGVRVEVRVGYEGERRL